MIDSFSKGALDKLNSNGYNKYYVYRLIDPRSFQTFYVGKGCDNRVFMHAKAATALISKDEDAESLKLKLISERYSTDFSKVMRPIRCRKCFREWIGKACLDLSVPTSVTIQR